MDWTASETIAALATPPGVGGVAVIRLSGLGAGEIATQVFVSQDQTSLQHGQMSFGKFLIDGDEIDHGYAVLFEPPRSFTGEQVVELHMHGGRVGPQALLMALEAYGARAAEPGEFSFRAFLHGKIGLDQAEGLNEIVRAQSMSERNLLHKRVSGALRVELDRLMERYTRLLSELEVNIDFPEEEFVRATRDKQLQELQWLRRKLIWWHEQGTRNQQLRGELLVVIAGRSNVGKSSLMNCLLGEERVLVDAQEGTTRDFVDVRLEIDGLPCRIMDTAGLRESSIDKVERQGMKRSEECIARADLLIWVDDLKSFPTVEELLAIATEQDIDERVGKEWLWVVNKMDQIGDSRERQDVIRSLEGSGCFPITCKEESLEAGRINAVQQAIYHTVSQRATELSRLEISLNYRHLAVIQEALQAVNEAIELSSTMDAPELVAETLWSGFRRLEELDGRSVSAALVESLFQNFCIGK